MYGAQEAFGQARFPQNPFQKLFYRDFARSRGSVGAPWPSMVPAYCPFVGQLAYLPCLGSPPLSWPLAALFTMYAEVLFKSFIKAGTLRCCCSGAHPAARDERVPTPATTSAALTHRQLHVTPSAAGTTRRQLHMTTSTERRSGATEIFLKQTWKYLSVQLEFCRCFQGK